MASPKLNHPVMLIVVAVISLFWGAVTTVGVLWRLLTQGPTKFFHQTKRDTRPTCLEDPSLGKHEFVELKTGVKIHYVISGPEDKPLMLFVHGFPEFWYSWRHQIREFNNDYRTVAIDMRGYGESQKPPSVSDYYIGNLVEDIKEFILALGYNDCILVAHDWGGAVAFKFAMKYPDMIQKLIVCNIPHPTAMQEFVQSSFKQFLMSWYIFLFQLPCLPEMNIKSFDFKIFEMLFKHATKGSDSDAFTPDDIEAYKYSIQIPGALTSAINYYRAAMRYRLEMPPGPDVKVPTLMVWGKKDQALHSDMAALSAKYIPDFQLKYIDGSGHWVQQEEPVMTNQLMREYLNQEKK